jgi:hypothetical protein
MTRLENGHKIIMYYNMKYSIYILYIIFILYILHQSYVCNI